MKKPLKKIIAVSIIAGIAFHLNSCAKKTAAPEQNCMTCIARDKLEGAPVDNERICSDEAEDSFRATYSDYNITCE